MAERPGVGGAAGGGTGGGAVGPGAPDAGALAAGELVVGDDGLVRPAWAAADPLLRDYYDHEWGRPVRDERGMFERISLEAFQSGLSWRTILAKRPAFRAAFAGFDPDAVAAFDAADERRLLADPGIVRNRMKIAATIGNARATIALRGAGGLVALVESFATAAPIAPRRAAEVPTRTAESAALAAALRAHGFAFVGRTTAFSLMTALGLVDADLVGAHRRGSHGTAARETEAEADTATGTGARAGAGTRTGADTDVDESTPA